MLKEIVDEVRTEMEEAGVDSATVRVNLPVGNIGDMKAEITFEVEANFDRLEM